MTFEEAKRRIEECMKQSTDDYNRYEDEVSRGEADAYKHALEILECIEPVGNPDKLTLKALAHELRKIFRFRYLTCEIYYRSKRYFISLWNGKPRWGGGAWWWCDNCDLIAEIKLHMNFTELNLSEYANENGEIDCSRCIVEVSDDAE